MSGSSAASGAGSGRFAGHEGVHAGVDTSYEPMRDQHHDTHAEAMAARAEHPAVKRRGIEPMTDLLSAGEKVLFPLNDGLHRGNVIGDVCTLGELYEGNLHVRVSGAKAAERVYRVEYTAMDADKAKTKQALFKRSDLEIESEALARGVALPTSYSQSTVPRPGHLEANSTAHKAPHREH